MPRPSHASCGRCKYVEAGTNDNGECHANPPTDIGWPMVDLQTGWCGEFSTGEHWLTIERREKARLAAIDARDEAEDVASDQFPRPIPARSAKAAQR